MALITCPECSKEVSSRAKACPNCGYPIGELEDGTPSLGETKRGLDPIKLWNGDLDGCKLCEYGRKPDPGYKLYTYEDIFRQIGIPKSLLMADHLGGIKDEDFIKLSPVTRSIGIQVDSTYVDDFEKLIEKQRDLMHELRSIKKNAVMVTVEGGENVSFSWYDMFFLDDTIYYKRVKVKEAYLQRKEQIERRIQTRQSQKALSIAASYMMMEPGGKPISASTSAAIGGLVGGPTGALYGAAKGLENQRSYSSYVDSYNDQKKQYANRVEQYNDEIRQLQNELLHLEIPDAEIDKHLLCFGVRTLIGVLPICFHDVSNDRKKYYYNDHDHDISCTFSVDDDTEEKIAVNGNQSRVSYVKYGFNKKDIDILYRKMQLKAFVTGKEEWNSIPCIRYLLTEKENMSLEEYLENIREFAGEDKNESTDAKQAYLTYFGYRKITDNEKSDTGGVSEIITIDDPVAQENIYTEAIRLLSIVQSKSDYLRLINMFEKIQGYKDVDLRIDACKKAVTEKTYSISVRKMRRANTANRFGQLADAFDEIRDFKDSSELAKRCRNEQKNLEDKNNEGIADSIWEDYKNYQVRKKKAEEMSEKLSLEEKEIEELERKIEEKQKTLSVFLDRKNRIEDMKKQCNMLDDEMEQLVSKKNSLGIFARKEKKSIDAQIEKMKKDRERFDQDLYREQNKMPTDKSLDDFYFKIEEEKTDVLNKRKCVSMLKSEISQEKNKLDDEWTESKIYGKLLDVNVLRYLKTHLSLGDKMLFQKDERIADFIEKNPIEGVDDYSPTSFYILNRIEQLDYKYNDKYIIDNRGEAELLDDIEDYLVCAKLLKDYIVEREVIPAAFDADKVIERHYRASCEKRKYDATYAIYSASEHGRPASFVISDQNHVIKLVIMVAKEYSFSHWLVKWCKLWCKDNDVPFLKILIGAPNTEHYIVRRTCEKMRLIKTNYRSKKLRNPRTGEGMEVSMI